MIGFCGQVKCGSGIPVVETQLKKAKPEMANKEVTSAKAASAAAKVLRNPSSSPAAKTAAASALTQRPNKK
jgi:hypothetical protein